MTPFVARILLAFLLLLVVLAVALLWALRTRRRARRYQDRLDFAVGTYRSSWSPTAAPVFQLSRKFSKLAPLDRMADLLHYDKRRQVYYPARFPVVVLGAAVLAGLLTFGGVIVFGRSVWFAAPVVLFFLCRTFYVRCEAALLEKLYGQFPDTLAMIVRSVRIGLPVVESIRIVAQESPEPTRREFKSLVDQTAIGVPLDQALREMATRNRLPEYRFFATALSLQAQTGGALSETLENLADMIRKRVGAKLKAKALASEARTTTYILGALPIVTSALLFIINPGYMSVLIFDDGGRKILFFGISMLSMGIFVMRTIIRKSLS
jgi:tight adherence protein B